MLVDDTNNNIGPYLVKLADKCVESSLSATSVELVSMLFPPSTISDWPDHCPEHVLEKDTWQSPTDEGSCLVNEGVTLISHLTHRLPKPHRIVIPQVA
ncbi:hypothetical protein AMTR_s00006p00172600 [Amborella trichopoda]|uniref:Uncharacterized protein n=1 Tax=Amborella trichopoda TaxID=13333 RepID=W1PCK6_AMBTC|nr:hypothetical protein AMTR_s00006p00172600 [Amborella trichopoda]